MGNKSKIEWREVSEDEYKYIKEKYASINGRNDVHVSFDDCDGGVFDLL